MIVDGHKSTGAAACWLCGYEPLDPITGIRPETEREFAYVRCRNCGLTRLAESISDASLQELYSHQYQPCCVEFVAGRRTLLSRVHELNFRRVAREIERRVGVGRLLDVGCGAGVFVSAMARRGWQVAGLEPNVQLAQALQWRLRADIRVGRLEEPPRDWGPFDAVTLLDVLEHVPDPRRALSAARSLLREGGALAILTPNIASLEYRLFGKHWFGFQAPDHVWLFTPESLTRLVEESGYREVALVRAPISYAWSSLLSVLRLRRVPTVVDTVLKVALGVPLGAASLIRGGPSQLELYARR